MPPTAFDYDVFISYSSQDKAWVRGELLTRLEAAGLQVIIDFRDFRLGAPSINEMERAVTTSRKTLLVLTPAYLASQWAEFENLMLQTLDPANRALRLIPLLKERCDLPARIGFLTYVDFTDSTEHDRAWQRLLGGLGAPLPSAASAPTPAAVAPPPASTTAATPSPAALRQLRNVLADLYPDKSSAARVAEDAGLPIVTIAVSDRAVDNWHAILREAQKHHRLATLLAVVREEYGGNRALVAAIQGVEV